MAMTKKQRGSFYGIKFRDQLRIEMVNAYGGKCQGCGETDPIILTLDHINDDPSPEWEFFVGHSRGGSKLYLKLKREGWPQGRFQLLCHNCNYRKEYYKRRENAQLDYEYADRSLGQIRRSRRSDNNSGFKGVGWNAQKGKWQARIYIHPNYIHLGFFTDIKDAARAYKRAALDAWGKDANVPTDEEIENYKPKEIDMSGLLE